MKIREQIERVLKSVGPWAQGEKGTAEIASDPFHLFGILMENPGGLRVLVMFKEETKRGDFEELGVVDRSFTVVLSRTKPMFVNAAEGLIKPSAGGKAMFDLVEGCRDVIRGVQFDEGTTEVTPDFRSAGPMPMPDGVVSDAFAIEFGIGTQLPAVR